MIKQLIVQVWKNTATGVKDSWNYCCNCEACSYIDESRLNFNTAVGHPQAHSLL